VPYDVVGTAEAAALAEGNPYSFLRVTRPEIQLPAGSDPHSEQAYLEAARALGRLITDGALIRDPRPAFYIYRQIMGQHQQVGVVGCCAVDEYDNDLIKKHEKTRPDKEEDRMRHILALNAQPGPVFLTYRDDAQINILVQRILAKEEPLYDFVASDGVAHTVWRVLATDDLANAFASIPALYVADGHHRSASASRARAYRHHASPNPTGQEEFNFFLSVLFPASQLRILPYNRVVHDLNGSTPEELLQSMSYVMEVSENGGPVPPGPGHFSMYLGGRWFDLVAPPELVDDPDPVESLDASILQGLVLAPLLGIEDPRTATGIDFVGGIRGAQELERLVDARGEGVAFSLHPVHIDQLLAVSDAGRVLPPKSTWFEPKLRSGLFVHEI
jgi:uncharacterized protein (DUF1015 family)